MYETLLCLAVDRDISRRKEQPVDNEGWGDKVFWSLETGGGKQVCGRETWRGFILGMAMAGDAVGLEAKCLRSWQSPRKAGLETG